MRILDHIIFWGGMLFVYTLLIITLKEFGSMHVDEEDESK